MKSEFENGIDAGLEISLNMINRELDSDFSSLGSALNFLWKVRRGYANINNSRVTQAILDTRIKVNLEPKFTETFCSQCGQEFGPGDGGYSSCKNHPKVGVTA
jgi:hypothetical protein